MKFQWHVDLAKATPFSISDSCGGFTFDDGGSKSQRTCCPELMWEWGGTGSLNVSHMHYIYACRWYHPFCPCDATLSNVLAIKSILRWFGLISGLKVNFRKSSSLKIFNMEGRYAMVLYGFIPRQTYPPLTLEFQLEIFSLQIDRSRFWKPVVESKLAYWKSESLSIGGRRITLPIYFFSIFKAPDVIYLL